MSLRKKIMHKLGIHKEELKQKREELAAEELNNLAESMPPSSGDYIIYRKTDAEAEVTRLEEEDFIRLNQEGGLVFVKIKSEDRQAFEAMLRLPTDWSSPGKFLENLANLKAGAKGSISTGYNKEITDGNTTYTFEANVQAGFEAMARISRIMGKLSSSGEVTVKIGKEGRLGSITFAAKLYYDVMAQVDANLKSLTVSATLEGEAGIEDSIELESKPIQIGGKDFQLDGTITLKAYGKAKLTAAAGAMVQLQYENVDEPEGYVAQEGLFGAGAGAWAGFGVAISADIGISTELNKQKKRLVAIGNEWHLEIGIGGKVDLNLLHKTEESPEGDTYDVEELTIGITAIAGLETVIRLIILHELQSKLYASLKKVAKKAVKGHFVKEIPHIITKAAEMAKEHIKEAVKAAAAKIGKEIKDGWDSGFVKNKYLTLRGKLGNHKLSIEGKIKSNNIKLDKTLEKLGEARVELNEKKRKAEADKVKVNGLSQELVRLQNLSDEEFAEDEKDYLESIGDFIDEDMFALIKKSLVGANKNELFKLIQEAITEWNEDFAELQQQETRIYDKIEDVKARAIKFNDYLEKHYKVEIKTMHDELDDVETFIEELDAESLSDKKQKKVLDKIAHLNKIVDTLRIIATKKRELLAEVKSLSDNSTFYQSYVNELYISLKENHDELKGERDALLSHIGELNAKLKILLPEIQEV